MLVLSWVFECLIHAMFCDTSWDWVLQMDLDDYLCWIFWIFPSICCANSKWRKISFDYFDPQQDPHQDFSCQNRHLFSDVSNLSKFSWQLRVGQKDHYLFIKRKIKIMKKQHKTLRCSTCLKKDYDLNSKSLWGNLSVDQNNKNNYSATLNWHNKLTEKLKNSSTDHNARFFWFLSINLLRHFEVMED